MKFLRYILLRELGIILFIAGLFFVVALCAEIAGRMPG